MVDARLERGAGHPGVARARHRRRLPAVEVAGDGGRVRGPGERGAAGDGRQRATRGPPHGGVAACRRAPRAWLRPDAPAAARGVPVERVVAVLLERGGTRQPRRRSSRPPTPQTGVVIARGEPAAPRRPTAGVPALPWRSAPREGEVALAGAHPAGVGAQGEPGRGWYVEPRAVVPMARGSASRPRSSGCGRACAECTSSRAPPRAARRRAAPPASRRRRWRPAPARGSRWRGRRGRRPAAAARRGCSGRPGRAPPRAGPRCRGAGAREVEPAGALAASPSMALRVPTSAPTVSCRVPPAATTALQPWPRAGTASASRGRARAAARQPHAWSHRRGEEEAAVAAAEAVGHLRRVGIEHPPLAVDHEGVVVHARLQRHQGGPDAGGGLVQLVARAASR